MCILFILSLPPPPAQGVPPPHCCSLCSLQYVSEVVIGAPYAVGKDLLDHFKVSCIAYPVDWAVILLCTVT